MSSTFRESALVANEPIPGYEQLANAFIEEQTQVVFALMGDANMYWIATIARDVSIVHGRHEAGVLAMADGYARASGQVGVCSVTCGPGVTNLLTPLRAAALNRTPLVIFAGDTPTDERGHLQEFNTAGLAKLAGAQHIRIDSPGTASQATVQAFALARREQIPVVLSVPADVQEMQVCQEPYAKGATASVYSKGIDKAAIEALASRVCGRRCLVLVGRGAVSAGALTEIEQLVDLIGAHVGTTLPAMGAMAHHPRNVGVIGGFSTRLANGAIEDAQVILVIGASLDARTTNEGTLFEDRDVLRIDELSVVQKADVSLHLEADAKSGVGELVAALRRIPESTRIAAYEPVVLQAESQYPQRLGSGEPVDEAELLDPVSAIRAVSSAVPAAAQIVVGAGHFWNYVIENFDFQSPNVTQFHYQFGAIAQAFPASLGAAWHGGTTGTIAIEGDGSLLMSLSEMETWARYRLPVLLVVVNDGAYGAEAHKLRAHGMDPNHAIFGYSPFERIASAFDIEAKTPVTIQEISESVRGFFDHPRPLLLDLRVSPNEMSAMYKRTYLAPRPAVCID